MEKATEKNVGIWIRVSTEDQAQGESPEHHEKRARMYAESKGWKVQDVYHLEAVSGKSVMGHREAERMLKDIRSGRITGLIFSKLARLARNTKGRCRTGYRSVRRWPNVPSRPTGEHQTRGTAPRGSAPKTD